MFFGETVTQRAFDGMAMYAWISAPESVPITTLRSDQIPTEDNNYAGQNYTGYANPEMDKYVLGIRNATTEDEIQAFSWKAQQLAHESAYGGPGPTDVHDPTEAQQVPASPQSAFASPQLGLQAAS